MKAFITTSYGSPDLLHLEEVEKPTPKENEVLIKIHATTVNRTDTATLRGIPFFAKIVTGLFKPKKPILGSEFAGEVEAVGKDVTSFKVGERVYGLNEDSFGSHAQFMCIEEDKAILTIPESISYEEAAASTEGSFYGYNFINKVKLQSGQRVLVNGATGAIGSSTVQLLQAFDVHVTAVCAAKNVELVKSLGADKVIDYTQEDFTKLDEKYNYVFDTVGKSSYFKCKHLLHPEGVYISSDLGFMSQNMFLPMITPYMTSMLGNTKTMTPFPIDCKEIMIIVKKLIEEGKFKTVIDRTYIFEEMVEAYKYVERGEKVGNVVITVEHNI